ncbi:MULTISPECIES: phosphatase PAP2 family protein [unclassified Blastococcus]|uniref:phosphatase PAP2 family protein n=2 Tax=Blastococcus TaxID=38501 RepID=UPI001EF15021|nr:MULTISPECIES: phosphatase PAP2 family protein [unclassified Blastococcus]
MGTPDGARRRGTALPATRRAVRRRRALLAVLLVAGYVALAVAVLTGSPLVAADLAALRWQPAARWPHLEPLVSTSVLLGQRFVCLLAIGGWLAVRFVRDRDPRPVVVVAVTTLLLNLTVGAAKTAFGRLGPLQLGGDALLPGGAEVFTDGMVFPSGHAANAVAMWGVVAYLARRHRRGAPVLAALVAAGVGASTVYLGTHWVSDVLAGWIAGALVLLALPAVGSLADRVCRRRSAGAPVHAAPSRRTAAALPPLPRPGWARDAA